MSKAYDYYARAIQCKMRAEEATDPDFKREFTQLAEKWNDLARQEEADRGRVFAAQHQPSHDGANLTRPPASAAPPGFSAPRRSA